MQQGRFVLLELLSLHLFKNIEVYSNLIGFPHYDLSNFALAVLFEQNRSSISGK
jgi:hypothetical protein